MTMPPAPASRRYRPEQPIGLGLPTSRRSPAGAVVAVLAHLLLFFTIIKIAPLRNLDYQANAGEAGIGRSGGGGGGSGRVQIVALPALA